MTDSLADIRQDILEAANAKLRAFALAVLNAADGGSLDGGDLQDIAVIHGVLEIVEMTAPCGEHCACAEYYGDDEIPFLRYRRSKLLAAPRPAGRAEGEIDA